MRTRYIFNPTAGHCRRRPDLAQAIVARLAAPRLAGEFCTTERSGHATALAAEAVMAGFERVVAIGGDGTVNEVAQALIGTAVELAMVPCGSGNGLASHLGIPRRLDRALDLMDGDGVAARWMDTGRVNGHLFLNVMGLGLDAEVSARFQGLVQRGLPAYVRLASRVLREHRPEPVTLLLGDRAERLEVLLLAVANSEQYGNAARIAPGAAVDDGELDLVAIPPVGPATAASLALRLFTGRLHHSRHVRRWRGDRLILEREGPGLIHTDGEPRAAAARLEITVHPRSLRVLAPGRGRPGAFRAAGAETGLTEASSTLRRNVLGVGGVADPGRGVREG